jgi:hypothetical protein
LVFLNACFNVLWLKNKSPGNSDSDRNNIDSTGAYLESDVGWKPWATVRLRMAAEMCIQGTVTSALDELK